MPRASLPPLHSLARWRGSHGLCAALALGLAMVQAASLGLACHGGAGLPPKARLLHYVPWIDQAMRLPGVGAGARQPVGAPGRDRGESVAGYARYYAWSKSNPGDVRVVLLRDAVHAGVHLVEVDDIPRSAEGVCDFAARVDVVRRRVMEVGCNPGV